MPKDSSAASKAEIAAMKRNAREADRGLQDAYESGVEEGRQGQPAATVPTPGPGGGLSFSNDAQKVIVIAMTITVMVSLIENANAKNKSVTSGPGRIIIGGFIASTLLLGASYFLPEFASGLAIVAMVATVLDRGQPFWEVVTKVTSRNPPAVVPPKAPVATPVPMTPNYAVNYTTNPNPILST